MAGVIRSVVAGWALGADRRRGKTAALLLVLLGLTLWPATALANFTVPNVGYPIVNPVTGLTETVSQIISPAAVETSAGNVIFLANQVGDSYTDPVSGHMIDVTAVTTDGLGLVSSVTLQDQTTSATSTQTIVQNASAPPGATNGSGSSGFSFPTAAGDHVYTDIQIAKNGGNGHDGGGVDILGVCICYGPSDGGTGATGPTLNDVVTGGPYTSTSTSNNLPAISVASYGGNGGNGGSFYGVGTAASGGAAGAGGDVTVTNYATASTAGTNSYGILAQSSAGKGGDGGSGYIFAGGGSGGNPAMAGNVTVTNYGNITTQGTGAIGILAESLGGAAGSGGSSYGIVSQGGGGSEGGNGGSVTVYQYGNIQTSGQDAHGVLAQSVGGGGGAGQGTGGLVSLGASGAGGGYGGTVTVTQEAAGSIVTERAGGDGIFAQSVGGGGGAGRARRRAAWSPSAAAAPRAGPAAWSMSITTAPSRPTAPWPGASSPSPLAAAAAPAAIPEAWSPSAAAAAPPAPAAM